MRRYYSSRKRKKTLTLEELYEKLKSLYLLFRDKAYFKEKAGITDGRHLPDAIKHEASIALGFQPFPITKWVDFEITEDNVFDTIEFLYDCVSKPGQYVEMTSDTGYNYTDYDGYDEEQGRKDFRTMANSFLQDYKSGFELSEEGNILALGADGLQHILDAEILPYDEVNVDSKVRDAISKWRNRHLSQKDKKDAIRELADVFEWLKKTKRLGSVLDGKDDSAIFELANNFGIRHHNPKQKTNYDSAIRFSWIFHFYLATYHAVVRLLIQHEQNPKSSHKKEG